MASDHTKYQVESTKIATVKSITQLKEENQMKQVSFDVDGLTEEQIELTRQFI